MTIAHAACLLCVIGSLPGSVFRGLKTPGEVLASLRDVEPRRVSEHINAMRIARVTHCVPCGLKEPA